MLIVGLGNPGEKYEKTRHNAGFLALDKLRKKYSFPEFEFSKKFNSEISKGSICQKNVFLIKPQTFMNESGTAVRAFLNFHKLSVEDILVIHDDLDIIFGEIRLAFDSRSAGHNGVQNIIDQLGTQKFKRIRIGIGKPPSEKVACYLSAHDYVLEKFFPEELNALESMTERIVEEVEKSIQQKCS
jgi:peptidyl-tRNA hydrolase, PTH1 family